MVDDSTQPAGKGSGNPLGFIVAIFGALVCFVGAAAVLNG